jgi:hypothetical protein
MCLLSGVSLRVIVAYIAYEFFFRLAPGIAVYVALSRDRQIGLREVATGWAFGYALELGAFSLTAYFDRRALLFLYPPLVLLAAAALRPRSHLDLRLRIGRGTAWCLAVIAIILVVYVAEGFFTFGLGYDQDVLWSLSMVAEARNHFPLGIPSLSGLPIHYHTFAFMNLAASGQVAHIASPDVVYRLYPIAIVLTVLFQTFAIVRSLADEAAGVLAVLLVLLVGDLGPWPRTPSSTFDLLFTSQTFGIGLVLFLGLISEVLRICDSARVSTDRAWGRWVIVLALMVTASGTKPAVLPVVGMGCALGCLWSFKFDQTVAGSLAACAALAFVVFVCSWMLFFQGAAGGLHFALFSLVRGEQPFVGTRRYVPSVFSPVFWTIAAAVAMTKLILPLIPGLVVQLRRNVRLETALLASILLAGFGFLNVFRHPGDSEAYFFAYGYVGAAMLAGVGWRRLIANVVRPVHFRGRYLFPIVVFALIVLAIDAPAEQHPKRFWNWLGSAQRQPLASTGFVSGLRWVAHHTPTDAVIAVDTSLTGKNYCFYTALAERRALLECENGWFNEGHSPFSGDGKPLERVLLDRYNVNEGIFRRFDKRAVNVAASRYGVSYIVLNLANGVERPNARKLAQIAQPVFANDGIAVFAVS